MYIPMIRAMLTKLNPTVKTPPPSKPVKQYSEELKGVNGGEER